MSKVVVVFAHRSTRYRIGSQQGREESVTRLVFLEPEWLPGLGSKRTFLAFPMPMNEPPSTQSATGEELGSYL